MTNLNDHPITLKKHTAASKPNDVSNTTLSASQEVEPSMLANFISAFKVIESCKSGKSVSINGSTLSVAEVTAVARYNVSVQLDASSSTIQRVSKSRNVVVDKLAKGISIYGLSTGFGGSADTRTSDTLALGSALLQHQQAGILPSSTNAPGILPLLDPLSSTCMPESWVRGAILIRMNSLIRGHSGVRWELIEKMAELLRANITPMVPLRGSISASGDLSPLSYIAGTLVGNPSIRVFTGPVVFGPRETVPSCKALAAHNIEPLPLLSKEHLGILNGTAFSASVAALALDHVANLLLLAQVCTAMGTEALLGTRESYNPFIHAVARPHPGQVEVARNIWYLLEGSKLATSHERELNIQEDQGTLRQDRYPLRTSPQFLGPQIEDFLSALSTITQECNSTTDNPLIDGETGDIHHGGNFQAMAVTNAMEKTRLSLHHIGKLLFAQCAELVNPVMNRGLPPSLAATDPSINYHAKGLEIATASYVSELGYLANPVSTHIQSAEMHNQAINSLALLSARATTISLDVLSMLIATYLYVLCQALELRALQSEFMTGFSNIASEELYRTFGSTLSATELNHASQEVTRAMREEFESTSTMDATARMQKVAASSTTSLVDFLTGPDLSDPLCSGQALSLIPAFRTSTALRSTTLLDKLRMDYLSGARGPAPASPYLGRTRAVYEFVRVTLGIRMHGSENLSRFANGLGTEDITIGQNVSIIYEAIRDGDIQEILASLFV